MPQPEITTHHQGTYIDINRGNQTIRINSKHLIYLPDIIGSFDYYYDSVVPINNMVDTLS